MSTDRYSSLDELKAHKRVGIDYRVIAVDRKSPLTIISPHGGFIEPGTSAIAKALAGRKYNFFDFQGLVEGADQEFHVTARNFRDPLLNELLDQSVAAIAIHGMGTESDDPIWLGGRNKVLHAIVAVSLEKAGFAVNVNPPRYKGIHPKNVVNLAKQQGVQLELSDVLRHKLFVDKSFSPVAKEVKPTAAFRTFIRALRKALALYEQNQAFVAA